MFDSILECIELIREEIYYSKKNEVHTDFLCSFTFGFDIYIAGMDAGTVTAIKVKQPTLPLLCFFKGYSYYVYILCTHACLVGDV